MRFAGSSTIVGSAAYPWRSRRRRTRSPAPTGRRLRCFEASAAVRSAPAPDTDARAPGPDGTLGAARRDRNADVLAEGHEQVVVPDPIAARQLGAERHLGLLGIRRPDV